MPNVQKFNNHKSLFADAIVTSVAKELVQEIEKYLDDKQELEFNDTVNRSFANEQMRMVVKKQEVITGKTEENCLRTILK